MEILSWKVSSSNRMEAFAAKSVLVNLVVEHDLEIYSMTTDRSSDMKVLLTYVIFVDKNL